jgi:hypothetical protein
MLRFSLPRAACLPFTKSSPNTPLDKNATFIYLAELDKKLRAAKESMEPYFKKYEKPDGRNLFKTLTSNLASSFKQTRSLVAEKRNTPGVTIAWLKCHEIINEFNLIPENHVMTENDRMQWNHFDNCSFPGSFVLAVYHFIYTIRNAEFQSMYNWFASSLLSDSTQDVNHPSAALGDQYELYKRYPEHWLMDPKNNLNGNILDINYINHIEQKLGGNNGGQVDLYTSEFGVDVSESKQYNEQEFVHAKGDIAQVICGLKTLRKDGNFVCKIFTFFNPFTLSLIALMRECFEEFYICKPASSKPDNSEVFLVGKDFNPDKGAEASAIMTEFLADENSDYHSGELVPLNKLDGKFWKRIKEAAYKIFEELQISRINNNIVLFEELVATCGDPINNREIEENIKRKSRELYQERIDDDNKTWFAKYPVLVLHKKHRLNIIDITERSARKDTNNRPRFNNYSNNRYSENKTNKTTIDYSIFGRTTKK